MAKKAYKRALTTMIVPTNMVEEVRRFMAKKLKPAKPIKRDIRISPVERKAIIERGQRVRDDLRLVENELNRLDQFFERTLSDADEKWVNDYQDDLMRVLDKAGVGLND